MDSNNETHGRCLCGEVRFRATLPSRWVAHCHCTICRRNSGAAFVTWVGLDAAGVAIDAAEGALHWRQSSANAQRGFCGHCGTPLFFRSSRWPGELHVTRANFDGPVDREPQAHVFWDTHVDWIRFANDGLPRKNAADVD